MNANISLSLKPNAISSSLGHWSDNSPVPTLQQVRSSNGLPLRLRLFQRLLWHKENVCKGDLVE